MGNSVRSTLGNLCGGQQAAKESPDDDDRPVAKPKEVKKKEKKSGKKNKKEKNGDVTVPLNNETANHKETDVDDTKPTVETNTEQSLSDEKSNADNDADSSDYDDANEEKNDSERLKTEKHLNNDDISAQQDNAIDAEKFVNDTQAVDIDANEVIEQSQQSCELKVSTPVDIQLTESSPINTPPYNDDRLQESSPNTPSLSDSFNISKDDLSSADEVDKNTSVHYIFEISPINPETIGITYADDIFEKSKNAYEPVVESAKLFKSALVTFNSSVLPAEVSDFDKCWNAYLTLLNEETNTQSTEKQRTESRSQVDICDVSVNLQQLRAVGLVFLDEVERVKPQIQQLLGEAGKVDVIEYVKGKMVEGEQLGITSKFSAPGKYRRNMKQLKKASRDIDGSQIEVRYVVDQLEEQEERISSSLQKSPDMTALPIEEAAEEEIVAQSVQGDQSEPVFPIEIDSESVIMPTEKKNEDVNGVFEVISNLPMEKKKRLSSNRSTDANDDKKPTLLEKSAEANIENESENKTEPITYVIENIPEGESNTPPTASSTPIGRKETFEIREIKTPREEIKVTSEEHNTLDYGKYVFIDPTTGDIQTMRNRSRSLDSLVSMTSNRSSISRFGSFELVTDFEINIAEQNQQKLLT